MEAASLFLVPAMSDYPADTIVAEEFAANPARVDPVLLTAYAEKRRRVRAAMGCRIDRSSG